MTRVPDTLSGRVSLRVTIAPLCTHTLLCLVLVGACETQGQWAVVSGMLVADRRPGLVLTLSPTRSGLSSFLPPPSSPCGSCHTGLHDGLEDAPCAPISHYTVLGQSASSKNWGSSQRPSNAACEQSKLKKKEEMCHSELLSTDPLLNEAIVCSPSCPTDVCQTHT